MDKKSKEQFQEWFLEKAKQKKEKHEQEEIERKNAQQQNLIKKSASEQAYEEWLNRTKEKTPRRRHTYGYSGGNLLSYYDLTSTPPPSYVNPLPWVSPTAWNTNDFELASYSSPPLLWRDVHNREKPQSKSKKKMQRGPSKRSSVDQRWYS